jgi:hypothetical protein
MALSDRGFDGSSAVISAGSVVACMTDSGMCCCACHGVARQCCTGAAAMPATSLRTSMSMQLERHENIGQND